MLDDALPEDRLHPLYTAYHEAGHAVAYLLSGLAFEDVTIVSDDPGDHIGLVRRAPTMTWDYLLGLITAAGPAAEAYLHLLHTSEEDPDYDDEVVQVLTVSLTLRDSLDTHAEVQEAHGMYDRALSSAAELVVTHWASIDAVATALLDQTTLTYDECVGIADLR